MRGDERLKVDIHFDLVCPWCFIGKRQFALARERFAQLHPGVAVQVAWHGTQLLPDVPEQGLPYLEFYERRLGSMEAVRARQRQVIDAADAAGLELDLGAIVRMPNTARAHRLLRQVERRGDPELHEALIEHLLAAYFRRGEDIGDVATLRALAAQLGVTAEGLDDPAPAAAAAEPVRPAVSGVPHFVFDGQMALAGARDAAILLEAMGWATRLPVPPAHR